MYLNGVSTRKVKNITEELCGYEITSSQVVSYHIILNRI
jgi:transposase-like protein